MRPTLRIVPDKPAELFQSAIEQARQTRDAIEQHRHDLRLTIMETRIRLAELRATLRKIEEHV